MLIAPSESETCDGCGAVNFVLRRRCRFCGADLVQHPDPEVDREVRLDAEDGRRLEALARKNGEG